MVALITGSSRGIGFGLARGLALIGYDIVLNARNIAALEDSKLRLQDELKTVNKEVRVTASCFDITDSAAVDEAIESIENEFGTIDVLINNAGIQARGLLIEIDPILWDDVIATNLKGAFTVGRSVAKKR